jgi:hypothetical protein
VIHVTKGFTSIEVAPHGFSHFNVNRQGTTPPAHSEERRASTGARVTVEFSTHVPLPSATDIRVHYDFAENGEVREIVGVPKLTHTTAHRDDRPSYHYRLSHWILAEAVMRFVEA